MENNKIQDLNSYFRSYSDRGVGKLFIEIWEKQPDPSGTPIFNLQEEDTDLTYSLKKLYLQFYKDPLEVEFVDHVLGGRFDLWTSICQLKDVKNVVETWRAEAKARYLADNFKSIATIAETSDSKTSMAALKYLCTTVLNSGKESSERGRPSKKEIEQKTREMLNDDKDIQKALERVQGSYYC